jgi:hypothetical protein
VLACTFPASPIPRFSCQHFEDECGVLRIITASIDHQILARAWPIDLLILPCQPTMTRSAI